MMFLTNLEVLRMSRPSRNSKEWGNLDGAIKHRCVLTWAKCSIAEVKERKNMGK